MAGPCTTHGTDEKFVKNLASKRERRCVFGGLNLEIRIILQGFIGNGVWECEMDSAG
jgi:hypothetical protein